MMFDIYTCPNCRNDTLAANERGETWEAYCPECGHTEAEYLR